MDVCENFINYFEIITSSIHTRNNGNLIRLPKVKTEAARKSFSFIWVKEFKFQEFELLNTVKSIFEIISCTLKHWNTSNLIPKYIFLLFDFLIISLNFKFLILLYYLFFFLQWTLLTIPKKIPQYSIPSYHTLCPFYF